MYKSISLSINGVLVEMITSQNGYSAQIRGRTFTAASRQELAEILINNFQFKPKTALELVQSVM